MSRSASRDESRPVLTGILVRFEPREGGHGRDRLLPAGGQGDAPAPARSRELEAIIPARALQELARIAAGADEVQLGVHENHVVFGVGGAWLTSRRIDGQFPNYRQLMPEQFEHELVLPREELLEVVRRMGLLAQRNSPLRLRFSEGELTVSAQTQDVGQARESLPAPYHAAEPLEIGFNAEFLRDGLESIDSAERARQADQPAAPRGARGRDRRLHLPDHADPSRRLIVGRLTLRNFRSYASARRSRSRRASCSSWARTAPGKTNLLESLHVATQGFSPRTRLRRAADPLRSDRRRGLAFR